MLYAEIDNRLFNNNQTYYTTRAHRSFRYLLSISCLSCVNDVVLSTFRLFAILRLVTFCLSAPCISTLTYLLMLHVPTPLLHRPYCMILHTSNIKSFFVVIIYAALTLQRQWGLELKTGLEEEWNWCVWSYSTVWRLGWVMWLFMTVWLLRVHCFKLTYWKTV